MNIFKKLFGKKEKIGLEGPRPDESKYNGKVCPIESSKCDHKCGYPAHGRIIRKNRCSDCGGGLAPDEAYFVDGVWNQLDFICESCKRTFRL